VIEAEDFQKAKEGLTVLSEKDRMEIPRPKRDGQPVPLFWMDAERKEPGPAPETLKLPRDLWRFGYQMPDGRFVFPNWVRHLIIMGNIMLNDKIKDDQKRDRVMMTDQALFGTWKWIGDEESGVGRTIWQEGEFGKRILFKWGIIGQGIGTIRVNNSMRKVATGDPGIDPDWVKLPQWDAERMNIKRGQLVIVIRDPLIRDSGLVTLRADFWKKNVVGVHPSIILGQAGDFDGDLIAVIATKSEESQKELRNLLPSLNKIPERFPIKHIGWTDYGISLDQMPIYPERNTDEGKKHMLDVLENLSRNKRNMGSATLFFSYQLFAAGMQELAFSLGGVALQAVIDKNLPNLDISRMKRAMDEVAPNMPERKRKLAKRFLMKVASFQDADAIRATKEGIRILENTPTPYSEMTNRTNLPLEFRLTQGGTSLRELWSWVKDREDPIEDLNKMLIWGGKGPEDEEIGEVFRKALESYKEQ
jgi:hypothetical protein